MKNVQLFLVFICGRNRINNQSKYYSGKMIIQKSYIIVYV